MTDKQPNVKRRHEQHVKAFRDGTLTQKPDPLESLDVRERRYVEGRLKGKSKRQSALAAGYSESMADNAGIAIENPDVRRAFRELARQAVPAEKIVKRLAEGLDAMETKFFQEKGEVTASRDVIAWGERREYLELAAKFGGYFVDKSEVTLNDTRETNGVVRLAELLGRAAERANEASDASRAEGSQQHSD